MLRKLFGGPSKGQRPSQEPAPTVPVVMGSDDVDDILHPGEVERTMPGYQGERRAFDKVQQAEAAATAGDRASAERLFREAVELDRRAGAQGGSGYVHARYSAFLKEVGRATDAIRVYEEAVRVGTDFPAIYGPL